MGRVVLLLLLAALAGCQSQSYNYEDAKISFMTYGGFVPDEMAVQILNVEPGKVSYEIQARNGTIMVRVEKGLPEEKYNALISSLKKAEFFQLKEKLDVNAVVMDAGSAEIEVKLYSGKAKKVVIDPYYVNELSPGIQELNQQLLSLISFARSTSKEEVGQTAEKWIRQAPTFRFDGENLELKSHVVLESFPEQHVLEYSFISRHGGYGDRAGQIVTQVITPHVIKVGVVEGKIASAVIDGKWDELRQKLL